MSHITPRQHVRSMNDPDGAVLLDVRHGKYFSINAVGAEIWRQIETDADQPRDGQSRDSIVTALGSKFSVPVERLERDVDSFLAMLESRDLIDVRH